MFGGEIEMLPERQGNRMGGVVLTEKTQALGWKSTKRVKDYIKNMVVK